MLNGLTTARFTQNRSTSSTMGQKLRPGLCSRTRSSRRTLWISGSVKVHEALGCFPALGMCSFMSCCSHNGLCHGDLSLAAGWPQVSSRLLWGVAQGAGRSSLRGRLFQVPSRTLPQPCMRILGVCSEGSYCDPLSLQPPRIITQGGKATLGNYPLG